MDYLLLNQFGYSLYSVYLVVTYVEQKRIGLNQSVAVNDLVFALHGWLLNGITMGQCFKYGFDKKTVSIRYMSVLILLLVLNLYNICLGLGGKLDWYTTTNADYPFNVVSFFGCQFTSGSAHAI